MKTYAVGDVHGMGSALFRLVERCLKDAGHEAAKFVFLGDYLDRGPQSSLAIQLLIDMQSSLGAEFVCLRGNHEAMALAAIEDSRSERLWLLNGGAATLRSYDVASARDLPADHIVWLRSLPTFHDDGKRLFVHAGIDPDRPLHDQREHDLLWIRGKFLEYEGDFGRFVVHGHTPVWNGLPDLREYRVNIDTGAAYGGPLTAAVFNDADARPTSFLQAR